MKIYSLICDILSLSKCVRFHSMTFNILHTSFHLCNLFSLSFKKISVAHLIILYALFHAYIQFWNSSNHHPTPRPLGHACDTLTPLLLFQKHRWSLYLFWLCSRLPQNQSHFCLSFSPAGIFIFYQSVCFHPSKISHDF